MLTNSANLLRPRRFPVPVPRPPAPNPRVLLLALMASIALAQDDAKTVVANTVKAMGAAGLRSVQYSGSGSNFALGQNAAPSLPWPRFNVKTYTRAIDYETVASREEMLRTQGENPPRGGGGQPLAGEQRLAQFVSGKHAWNLAGNNPAAAPAALAERLLQIWLTPHGFLKAAQANTGTKVSSTSKSRAISFTPPGGAEISATVNEQFLITEIRMKFDNPVLGSMPVEAVYSGYKDFAGVMFPTRIVQRQGGSPTLELTITDVRPNAPVQIEVPAAVRQAAAPPPPRVETQKLADGVFYLTGGSHHSVAVEFKDHVAVIEGPLNDERSRAVIAEVKKAIPNKPLKYLINTHHHFDHSGGLRAYVAEGSTIVTHQVHKAFYEKVFATPKSKPRLLTVGDKRVLSDGARSLELHVVKASPHHDGILMAYLPKEKLLVEVDVYTPAAPGAPAPAAPNPVSVNLYDNIQRLKLDVAQIAALHGRLVPLAELEKAIGKPPSK